MRATSWCLSCAATVLLFTSPVANATEKGQLVVDRIRLATAARVCGVEASEVTMRLGFLRSWLVEEAPRKTKELDRMLLVSIEEWGDIAKGQRDYADFCPKTLQDYRSRKVSCWRYPR